MIYYILLGVIVFVSFICRIYMQLSLSKYFDKKTADKVSGFEVAKKVLVDNNKDNLYIVETKSNIFNYYDVNNNSIRFSRETFNGEDLVNVSYALFVSVLACMSDKYYKFRSKMYIMINYIIRIAYTLLILCILLRNNQLCYAIILIISVIFVYQLINFSVNKEVINKCVDKYQEEDYKKVLNIIRYKELSIFIDTVFNIFR